MSLSHASVVDAPIDADMLYGPSYYPSNNSADGAGGGALTSSFGSLKQNRASTSAVRQQVPYLQDLRMSRELMVYQPASAVSAQQASQMAKLMSLGVKTAATTGGAASSGAGGAPSSKGLSFAVPQVHSAIVDWDDGSLHRRASGVGGVPPMLVGGKPLPSISVSCEEGNCARNFYELKQHREGWDASANGDVEEDSILSIPQWPERAATPEEIAVERQFAEEAPHWHDVYWQRVTAARKQEELQSQLEQQQQRRAAMGGGGAVQGHRSVGGASAVSGDVAFSRSASIASSVTTAAQSGGLPTSAARGPMMHAMMSRKPSMPVLHRMSGGVGTMGGSSLRHPTSAATTTAPTLQHPQPRLSFPRWNGSQKLDNHFRREASISSVSSSVLEHASSQCSSTKGSLRELRRSSMSQGSGPVASKQRRGSGTSSGTFPRAVKSLSVGEKVGFSADGSSSIQARSGGGGGPSSQCGSVAPNDPTSGSGGSPTPPTTAAAFARETIAEKRVQALRRSLSPPVAPGPTGSETDELTATDDNVQFASAHHLLSSTVSTVEQSDLMRSTSATPITKPMHDEDTASSLTRHNNSSGALLATDAASPAALSGSGGTAGRSRPPIPWSSEWSLPIVCRIRRVADTTTSVAWDDAGPSSDERVSNASSTPSITFVPEEQQLHDEDADGPTAHDGSVEHGGGRVEQPAGPSDGAVGTPTRANSCTPNDHAETRGPSEQPTLSPSPLRQGTSGSLLDTHMDPGTEAARDGDDSLPSSTSRLNRTNGHNPTRDDNVKHAAVLVSGADGAGDVVDATEQCVAADTDTGLPLEKTLKASSARQPPPPPPPRGEKRTKKVQPKRTCCNVM